MRQVMPNTGWRVVDNNVPDYIPVQFQMEAAEAVRQIMDDMEVPTRDVAELISQGMVRIDNLSTEIPSDPVFLDGNTFITSSNTTANTVYHVGHSIGGFDIMTTTSTNTTRMEMSMDDIREAQRRIEELHREHTEEVADESELEEEPVVRKRTPRRKKERPPFWKEETSGQTTTLPTLIGQLSSNFTNLTGDIRGTLHASSPYVKLIPLKVLNNHVDADHRRWIRYSGYSREANYQRNMINRTEVLNAMNIANLNTGLSQIVNNMIFNNRINQVSNITFERTLRDATKFFITDNNLVNVNYTSDSASGFNYTNRAFREGEAMRIHARTFAVSLGQLTCFLETESYSRVYTPQVLAVVLPENYVYQKWHILTYGTIDLSKVIVLVNRELDDTDFHHKNFRAYYRKYLLPVLNDLKVDVWKVPVSFMEEYCFHQGITLEKKSFMERRQETETVFDSFRNQFMHYNLDPHEDDDDDDDEDDYDRERDYDDDDY